MAWTPLSSRIDNLPKILAGPILRRVEKDTVSVWIAYRDLTNLSEIKLKIYNESETTVLLTGTFSNGGGAASFGSRLGICVITAKAANISEYLTEGTTYRYDVLFKEDGTSPEQGLRTPGMLFDSNYTFDISYDGSGLPSFAIPPSDPNYLNVVHGSCRKPHGGELDGKYDALFGLDKVINKAYQASLIPNPVVPEASNFAFIRPHFLFLTGDQIYADDVADMLLFMLEDASLLLMGWNETLAGCYTPPTDPRLNFLFPGLRSNLRPQSGFTSTEDKSHLVKLGEFYCMYLFAWSDLLWPAIVDEDTNDLPVYQQVYIGDYSLNIKHKSFDKEKRLLIGFHETLRAVRRALANVPTYMIFDDHEVTDDWNINLEWFKAVHGDAPPNDAAAGKPLGRRIIQNSLSAYAVFQAWGNTPDKFQINVPGNTGGQLFQNLINYPGDEWNHAKAIQGLLFPSLATDGSGVRYLSGGFDWSYHLQFMNTANHDHSYQFIIMNSRTRRKFGTNSEPKKYAALISDPELIAQIGSVTPKDILTFVISPAPCLGSYAIETLQAFLASTGVQSVYDVDAESWALNGVSLEYLLQLLSEFDCTVVLSGDVHYGYSRHIIYWNNRTTTEKISHIAQFVGSSLKNETDGVTGTRNSHKSDEGKGWRLAFIPPSDPMDFIGFTDAGNLIQKKLLGIPVGKIRVNGTPRVHKHYVSDAIKYEIVNKSVPHWAYRILPINDFRSDIDRSIDDKANTAAPYQYPSGTKLNYSEKQRRLKGWSDTRRVVGINNLATVTLRWGAVREVTQEFYYTPIGKTLNDPENNGAYVKHVISLGFVPSDKPGG